MKVSIKTISDFKGLLHLTGVKLVPEGECEHCKGKTVWIEWQEEFVDIKDVVDSLQVLVDKIRSLEF